MAFQNTHPSFNHASNDEQKISHAGDGNSARVDDLEGRLRGMIIKNKPSTAGKAHQDSHSVDPSTSLATKSADSVARGSEEASNSAKQRRKPRKTKPKLPLASIEDSTPIKESSIQDGQDLDKQHEAPRARGRRPNQAQRRQKAKVDLQGPLSTPTVNNPQPNSQTISPQIHRASHPQASGTPQVSIDPTKRQFSEIQQRQTPQHQQYHPIQQRQQQSHPPALIPQHDQNQYQQTSHARGFIPHAGHRFGSAQGHAIMAPPDMSNMHQSRVPQNTAHNSPSVASQYVRPLVPHGQLYQGHMATSSRYPLRSHFSHPETPAQNAFVHAVSEVMYDKAKASSEELQEKEALRMHLQRICAEAVSNFERARNPQFDAGSVALACFGSLRSGFATCGSDMDLALVSPASFPDPGSAESAIPRLLEKVLLDLGYGARLLTKTRVPIIRFCETPTAALSEALRENRAKWEREKDAPPKPKPKKIAQSENESKLISDENSNLSATSTSPSIKDHSDQTAMLDLTASRKAHNGQQNVESLMGDEAPAQQANDTVMGVTSRTDEELVHLYKLAIKEGWFEPSERLVIVKFIEAVKLYGADGDHKALVESRLRLQNLPDVLSRYRVPPESHLDYPKTGVGIQCDINFSNHLALHNTCLLKCYSLCDPRVQPMIVVVKAWAKNRKINSSYHGTLSSYGYVLMALHYLMNVVQPQIIPNLQLVPQASAPESDYGLNGYEVRFWRSEQEITEAARRGQLTQNHTDTVGSLLRGFFHYYAHPYGGGFSWATDVLSLRTPGGLLHKEEKGWTGARTVTVESAIPGEDAKEVRHRYLFAIEDPFELDHNVARTVVHNGIVAIRDEFRRADKIIWIHGAGKTMADSDLFAEAAAKENLQRRFFGPLIKPDRAGTYQKGDDVSKGFTAETPTNNKFSKERIASGKIPAGQNVETADRAIMSSEKLSSSVKEDSGQRTEATSRTPETEAGTQPEEPPTPVSSFTTTTDRTTPILTAESSTPGTKVSVLHNDEGVEANKDVII